MAMVRVPFSLIPAYSGAKAAVSNLTQWLAVHFANSGVRVNAIAPGFFVTNQNRGLLFNEDGSPTARTNKILNATPMGRFGEADELMGTVRYLLDDSMSSFVTGVGISLIHMVLFSMGFFPELVEAVKALNCPLNLLSPINCGAIAMILSIVVVPVVSLFTKAPEKEVVDNAFAALEK